MLVQKSADVNGVREAEEFDPIGFCTEHEPPINPFIFIWINPNHTTIHQPNSQPSCSSLGPAPPKAPAHLFPGILGSVNKTQPHSPRPSPPWSCKGTPIEAARPRLASPHRTSMSYTHPGIKGHDRHDHGPSFTPLHPWA